MKGEKRTHTIRITFEPDGKGGERMVCSTCYRPVGTVAFEYGPLREDYTRRYVRDFLRHYGKAAA